MKRLLLLLLLAVAGPAAAEEIKGPETIVPIGKSVWLEVTGVTVPEMQAGAIDVFPKGYDVDIRVLQDLRGTILIWFEANEANALQQYDILVSVPVPDVNDPSVAILKRLEWTIKTGEAPNPPPPPPPPPSKIAIAVIVWEAGESSLDVAIQLTQLRDNLALSKKLEILDQNEKDENDQPSPVVETVLAEVAKSSLQLPVIAGLSESSAVVFVEPLPITAKETVKLLTERGLSW